MFLLWVDLGGTKFLYNLADAPSGLLQVSSTPIIKVYFNTGFQVAPDKIGFFNIKPGQFQIID